MTKSSQNAITNRIIFFNKNFFSTRLPKHMNVCNITSQVCCPFFLAVFLKSFTYLLFTLPQYLTYTPLEHRYHKSTNITLFYTLRMIISTPKLNVIAILFTQRVKRVINKIIYKFLLYGLRDFGSFGQQQTSAHMSTSSVLFSSNQTNSMRFISYLFILEISV